MPDEIQPDRRRVVLDPQRPSRLYQRAPREGRQPCGPATGHSRHLAPPDSAVARRVVYARRSRFQAPDERLHHVVFMDHLHRRIGPSQNGQHGFSESVGDEVVSVRPHHRAGADDADRRRWAARRELGQQTLCRQLVLAVPEAAQRTRRRVLRQPIRVVRARAIDRGAAEIDDVRHPRVLARPDDVGGSADVDAVGGLSTPVRIEDEGEMRYSVNPPAAQQVPQRLAYITLNELDVISPIGARRANVRRQRVSCGGALAQPLDQASADVAGRSGYGHAQAQVGRRIKRRYRHPRQPCQLCL